MSALVQRVILGLILLIGIGAFILLSGWLLILTWSGSIAAPVAHYFPWPIACSTRGCVTTISWLRHHRTLTTFANAANEEAPLYPASLTTLLRQHLIHIAWSRSPVTASDVQRYREEILNIHDEQALLTSTGLSVTEYDRYVILPFLEQEALRSLRHVESLEELHRLLAHERAVFVLPFYLQWDSETATVITRD